MTGLPLRWTATLTLYAAAAMALASCGAGGGAASLVSPASGSISAARHSNPKSTPTPAPITAATASPTPSSTPAPSGTIVWKAGDATYGHWITANTYQCGNPVQSGTQFTMTLSQGPAPGGGYCGRNQANPVDASGANIRLNFGQQYTFTFRYIDGTPTDAAPGMGYDKDARSIIWQMPPYATGTGCTSLLLNNGGVIGGPERWNFLACGTTFWSGAYTAGETDDWKIVIIPSETSSGHITLYRNGIQVASYAGANVSGSTGPPWWNFGPYKWIWENSPNDSSMTTINATFQNMLLTTP